MRDLRDAVSFHQLVLAANGASDLTKKQYMDYQVLFLSYLANKHLPPELAELNPVRVREFLVWYRNQDHPRRTRGGEVAVRIASDVLKRLGQILEDNEYVEVNPLRKLQRPKVARFTRVPFSESDLNALWGACFRTMQPERDEALFLLMLDTGIRIGEACSMLTGQLDINARQLVVGLTGKGRRERLVPFGNPEKRDGGRVVRALRRYLTLRAQYAGDSPFVFVARDGRRLTVAGAYDVFRRLAASAGVEDSYPHRLRHTYATHFLTVNPGDEMGLRRILGQLSHNVLADYVHLAQTTIAQRAGRASIAELLLGGDNVTRSQAANDRTFTRDAYNHERAGPAEVVDAAGPPPLQERATRTAKLASPRRDRRIHTTR